MALHILSEASQGTRLSNMQPTMAVSGLIIGILGHVLFLPCDMFYLLFFFSTTRCTTYILGVCQVQLAIKYCSILVRVPYQPSVSTFSETRSTFLIPSYAPCTQPRQSYISNLQIREYSCTTPVLNTLYSTSISTNREKYKYGTYYYSP